MPQKFKVGDHVTWNSEAGYVSGTIIKVHTNDFDYKGYTHHASKDDPQYEIKSDKTDHIAAHKGSALKKNKPLKVEPNAASGWEYCLITLEKMMLHSYPADVLNR